MSPSFIAPALTIGSLAATAAWELLRRRMPAAAGASKRRGFNLGLWAVNGTLGAALFGQTVPAAATPLAWIGGLLLLDATSYANHRLFHTRLLWWAHRLHHCEPGHIDWSTAVRHHPVEYLVEAAVFAAVIPLAQIPAAICATYGTCVLVMAALTHGNVRWPRWAESMPAFITLRQHLVHHSPEGQGKNFGNVLRVWDRLFNTWRST